MDLLDNRLKAKGEPWRSSVLWGMLLQLSKNGGEGSFQDRQLDAALDVAGELKDSLGQVKRDLRDRGLKFSELLARLRWELSGSDSTPAAAGDTAAAVAVAAPDDSGATTFIFQNLPNTWTVEEFKARLKQDGYDFFVWFPASERNKKKKKSYAIVNFRSADDVAEVRDRLPDWHRLGVASKIRMVKAERQGFDGNYQEYKERKFTSTDVYTFYCPETEQEYLSRHA